MPRESGGRGAGSRAGEREVKCGKKNSVAQENISQDESTPVVLFQEMATAIADALLGGE